MPQGFQSFDSAGNVVVDLTSRLSKQLGTFDITATTTAYGSKRGEYSLVFNAPTNSLFWAAPINIRSTYGGTGLTPITNYYYKIDKVSNGYKITVKFNMIDRNHENANIITKFAYGIY